MFNGKIHYKWAFSIAMLVITRGYNWKEHRLDSFLMLMISRASFLMLSRWLQLKSNIGKRKAPSAGCSHRLSAEIGEPSEAVLSSPLYYMLYCYEHRVASEVSC